MAERPLHVCQDNPSTSEKSSEQCSEISFDWGGRRARAHDPLLTLALYLTNRCQVAVRLFSNRSQTMSKCGKNTKAAHEAQPSTSLMFLPQHIRDTLGCASCVTFLFLSHFDIICDLLLNRRTATWNLFALYNKELKYTGKSFNDDV